MWLKFDHPRKHHYRLHKHRVLFCAQLKFLAFSEVAIGFFFGQKRGLNPCFSAGGFNTTVAKIWTTRKRPQRTNISRWGGEDNRDKHGCQFHRLFINTWNVVQRNWVLSVGTVLSFFSPQWCVKTQKSVGFWELQRGLVRLVEEGQFFLTLYRSIYYILVVSETMSSLQDPWCWWW